MLYKASLVAEATNARLEVFVADVTSMSGLGSDGIAAFLFMCSLVCCGSHQYVFPCIQLLTLCGQLQGLASLHVLCHADIFESHEVRTAGSSPAQCHLTVEDVCWDATILHTAAMTKPSEYGLSKQSMHTGKTSSRRTSV